MSLKEIRALMANLRQAKAEQLQAMNSTGMNTIKRTKENIDSSRSRPSSGVKKVPQLIQ